MGVRVYMYTCTPMRMCAYRYMHMHRCIPWLTVHAVWRDGHAKWACSFARTRSAVHKQHTRDRMSVSVRRNGSVRATSRFLVTRKGRGK